MKAGIPCLGGQAVPNLDEVIADTCLLWHPALRAREAFLRRHPFVHAQPAGCVGTPTGCHHFVPKAQRSIVLVCRAS